MNTLKVVTKTKRCTLSLWAVGQWHAVARARRNAKIFTQCRMVQDWLFPVPEQGSRFWVVPKAQWPQPRIWLEV
jgi:hypothetical protein